MSRIWIKEVEAKGVHSRYNYHLKFRRSFNILHGVNGSGKTTILHILANILNGDFERFAYLDFKEIKLTLSSRRVIRVTCEPRRADSEIAVLSGGSSLRFARSEVLAAADGPQSPQSRHPVLRHRIAAAGIPAYPAAYFPAFRTMLEAWSSRSEDPRRGGRFVRQQRDLFGESSEPLSPATSLARELFGQFVPIIDYASPMEIQLALAQEMSRAQMLISHFDTDLFSETFVEVFSTAFRSKSTGEEDPQRLAEEIEALATTMEHGGLPGQPSRNLKVYQRLRSVVKQLRTDGRSLSAAADVLAHYRNALKRRQEFQQKALLRAKRYLDAMNQFLAGKQIEINPNPRTRVDQVSLRFDDDTTAPLEVLSSGERQILTLIFAASWMSEQGVVLVDEPELSLHADWQRKLLGRMADQMGDRQVIACTHSPMIAGRLREEMQTLEAQLVRKG